MSADIDQLERALLALQGDLAEAEARAEEHRDAITKLRDQRAELVDRLELTERQAAELAEQIEGRQAELEEARQQALYEAFLEAVERRDVAAGKAAAKIKGATTALAVLERNRQEVESALANVPARFKAIAAAEPKELGKAWQGLVGLVRSRLDQQLEDELLEAAAASTFGHAIHSLPVHLQEAARQRRRDGLRAAHETDRLRER